MDSECWISVCMVSELCQCECGEQVVSISLVSTLCQCVCVASVMPTVRSFVLQCSLVKQDLFVALILSLLSPAGFLPSSSLLPRNTTETIRYNTITATRQRQYDTTQRQHDRDCSIQHNNGNTTETVRYNTITATRQTQYDTTQ